MTFQSPKIIFVVSISLSVFVFKPVFAKTSKKVIKAVVSASSDPILLSNKEITLKINVTGGAFAGFEFKDQKLNPLSWILPTSWNPKNNQGGALFQGHFLCLGRWGAPSDAEIAYGKIPHNGEQTMYNWNIDEQKTENQFQVLNMNFDTKKDQISTNRTVYLAQNTNVAYVKESFTNYNTLGRLSNVVHHVTLGNPFLSKSTIISSNVDRGFDQTDSINELEKSFFTFPYKTRNGKSIDFRTSTEPNGYCCSFIHHPKDMYGWVTAIDPKSGLLIGYIWKTKEYPWLYIWHNVDEKGNPNAKGIEFGTAGLGKSYQTLVENNTGFFGKKSFEYIDAGQKIDKSFVMFIQKVPMNTKAIKNINIKINKEKEIKFGLNDIRNLEFEAELETE